MRSSGASADTSRANAGVAISISSMGRDSSGGVVRGDRDRAGTGRPVAPRVVGASLHDGIARLQVNLFGVEHECNLAFEHKAKIEGARLLHVGVRRVRAKGRSPG